METRNIVISVQGNFCKNQYVSGPGPTTWRVRYTGQFPYTEIKSVKFLHYGTTKKGIQNRNSVVLW